MTPTLPPLQLNPLLTVDFGPPVRCELPLEGRAFELPNDRWLELLLGFSGQMEVDALLEHAMRSLDLGADAAAEVVSRLIATRLLVPASEPQEEMSAVHHWIRRGWLEALLFHLRTRDLTYADDHPLPEAVADRVVGELAAAGVPPFWKDLTGAARVELPPCLPDHALPPLSEVLLRRRSNQPWRGGPVSGAELHTMLAGASHETLRLRQEVEAGWREKPSLLLRSSFSAVEVYVVALAVEGVAPGLYHWDPRGWLSRLRGGMLADELRIACVGQERAASGACAFVLAVDWARYMFRYRHPRALRTLFINVSELAQKLILLATALGLSTFLTPAFEEESAWMLIGDTDRSESVMEVVTVG